MPLMNNAHPYKPNNNKSAGALYQGFTGRCCTVRALCSAKKKAGTSSSDTTHTNITLISICRRQVKSETLSLSASY